MSRFVVDGNRLQYFYDAEKLWIEPWGDNSLRVRSTKMPSMPMEDWALLEVENTTKVDVNVQPKYAEIINGKIRAIITDVGKLTFYNSDGKILLDEYLRNRKDFTQEWTSALEIEAREFKPIIGGDYEISVRFESSSYDEKIYGMGQYQQDILNLKGADLELAHRNSQASVPFYLSSEGYGFFWNNPSVGRATFAKNLTTWYATSAKKIDYWITAGNSPAEITKSYANVTGKVPMMPDYALGFWQCKLRYQTQEELLQVAREYKRRNLPISVIVADFFHWPYQGEWKFDPTYWPDPDAMIAELKEMGIELMVSIWPQVDYRSENFEEMLEKGYLIRTERGVRISMTFQGNTLHIDVTNPEARKYLWSKVKQNYYDKGIRIFWLDEAEPEYLVYDFENYRYYLGPNVSVGNVYPVLYAKAFYEGMTSEGQENIVNLARCVWAGSQKYGTLLWSGDIHSSFKSFRDQLAAGLNTSLAGIPWWTTDIGGFHGGDPNDPTFRELIVRWFQWGTFCPVMRLHGDREPKQPQHGTTGGATCLSGADNEVWSFGEEAYEILKDYLFLRERIKPYVKSLMEKAHIDGTPVMRPLFYDFPEDSVAWEVEDAYMFGPDLLIAPILYAEMRARKVYLPAGTEWVNAWTGEVVAGNQTIEVDAPIEQIPCFVRKGADVGDLLKLN